MVPTDTSIFESFTPYEVAVFAFTSPRSMDSDEDRNVTLTGKSAYLWAGSVAHILIHNPTLNAETVVGFLRRAVDRVSEIGWAPPDPLNFAGWSSRDTLLLESFLSEANIHNGSLEEIRLRTLDAINSLEWRGIIEDPFKKRIGKILLAVSLLAPVNFTGLGTNDTQISAMAWVYDAKTVGDSTQRDFHVKVAEISHIILDELVPSFIKLVDKLTDRTEQSNPMSLEELQFRLKQLGYYAGAIDAKIGTQTIAALKRFQFDRNIRVSGYPDEATVAILRSLTSGR